MVRAQTAKSMNKNMQILQRKSMKDGKMSSMSRLNHDPTSRTHITDGYYSNKKPGNSMRKKSDQSANALREKVAILRE